MADHQPGLPATGHLPGMPADLLAALRERRRSAEVSRAPELFGRGR
ncbi:hypothetical protein [Jatrophihabitans sp.]|nr:hypothetical protein [Jatrophihabitans sp.]